MDGSKGQPKITAGLDLGDNHSCLCLMLTEGTFSWKFAILAIPL
jgi:hypothetical protein